MTESIQQKLLRVRPPRVRITYDVETGGAIEKRELPFIVGILADLSGDVPDGKQVPALRDRKIQEIDRDNINNVFKSCTPRVSLQPVLSADTLKVLKASGKKQDTELNFQSLEDLDPLNLVLALPTLSEKYRARQQLRGLQSRAETSDAIEQALDSWVGAGGSAASSALQAELSKALQATVPATAVKPTIRAALVTLQDKLLTVLEVEGYGKQAAGASAQDADNAKTAVANATDQLNAAKQQAAAAATALGSAQAEQGKLAANASDAQKKAAADKVSAAQTNSDTAAAAVELKQAAVNKANVALLSASVPDAQAALATAQTAALSVLANWGLTAQDSGLLLSNLLADSDSPENREAATKLLAALNTVGKDVATSTTEEKAQHKVRDDAIAALGQDTVAAAVKAIGPPDPAAPQGDPQWARLLLLQGLTAVDDPESLDFDSFADPSDYQAQVNQADGRNSAIVLAAYFQDAGNSRGLVAASLFNVLVALRNDDSGPATATALLRLHYFAEQILYNLQAQDADLLKVLKKGATAIIDEQVVLIDQFLSGALSTIMHSDSFMQVERTWRGLAYLVMNTETSTMLKLRVLNASKDDLRKDMEKAVEFDQSALFKKIYEAEYDTLGGTPYSLLVGDYEIGSGNDDISFLKKISEVAAASHAPFIAAASPQLFALTRLGFGALDKPRDLAKIFESPDHEGWREFRAMEDARYVSLVLPRALLRLPYGSPDKRNTIQCDGLNFDEQVGTAGSLPSYDPQDQSVLSYPTPDSDNFLFGNAAYLLAERITNAYSLYSWTAAIRGVEGGGLVENLPIYTYTSDSGTTEMLCPTEVAITDRREKELNDLGFISLCHYKGAGQAVFFGGQTTNAPKKYYSDSANANARISAMLPYMLAASRFAHYIKVIMRDKIGSFLTRGNIEKFLNGWISEYVLLDDNAQQDVKASYPLRAASVVVTEVPGQPGVYRATAFIKPHFQLEELTMSIRLVADLPS